MLSDRPKSVVFPVSMQILASEANGWGNLDVDSAFIADPVSIVLLYNHGATWLIRNLVDTASLMCAYGAARQMIASHKSNI